MLGGNKSLLFNVEYLITIAGPVRLVLFYDAGQVRDIGQSFAWKEDITERVDPAPPLLVDPFAIDAAGRPERAAGRPSTIDRADRARSRPRPAPRSGSSCRC